MTCPGCGAEMTELTLDGHAGVAVTIDLCTGCQAFWFDKHESLQLAPGSTLRLFSTISEAGQARKAPLPPLLKCPRCPLRLRLVSDLQRNTQFRYWRCEAGHGRFITFFDFLREKDFIRPLSPAQLAELRKNLQFVNCSNCGASVDLGKGAACSHCGSPISILDMNQAAEVIRQLQRAAEPRPIDPTLPLELARVRREVENAFGPPGSNPEWWSDVSSSGLVEASMAALVRWIKQTNSQ